MRTHHWYFLAGVLVGLLPLLLLVAVKKLNLLGVRADAQIVYQMHGRQALSLHHFAPAGRGDGTPAPALLLFHGGRWLYGSPADVYPLCQFFAAQGFHCFAAQYRLAPRTPPDVAGAVADARAALDYLLDNAADLRIDAARIAVAGGSAGGHLAAALGSGLPLSPETGAADPRRPAALLLYNPMLDLSPGTPDHHLVKDYWEQVSPLHHIDGAVPPALILSGAQDPEVPVETIEAYCDALHRAGGHCEIALYEGQSHGFYHGERYRDITNQRILQFLGNLPDWIAKP